MRARRKLLGVVVGLVVLSIVAVALADDDSDRKKYVQEIEKELENAADELDDVPGDSSTTGVDAAIRYAEKVDNLADRLEDVQGSDSTAKEMASNYPGYVKDFKESAGYLKKLKGKQASLKDLPRKCEDLEKKLRGTIKDFVEKKDPEGVDKLPREADRAGRDAESWWRDAERTKREMEDWRSRTSRFSASHGKWSKVKSELHGAAKGVFSRWENDWKLSDKQCSNLRKGGRHPAVEEALKKLAQFSKGREELVKELKESLRDAAKGVYNLHSQSSDRELDSALREAGEILSTISKLKYAKGTEKRANEIASNWPGYVGSFKSAVGSLRSLKKWQYTLDKAPEKCERQEKELASIIGKYLPSKDPAGLKDIPLRARGIGASVTNSLKKADEHKRNMEQFRRDAEKFSVSDGDWRDIVRNVRDSAKSTYDYWSDRLGKAHRACDEVAKGEGHSKVQKALRELGKERSDIERDFEKVRADYATWAGKMSELRKHYKRDTQAIRKALCESDEAAVEKAVRAVADRVRSRIEAEWNGLDREAKDLLRRLDKVESDKTLKPEAQKLKKKILKKWGSAKVVKDSGLFRGAGNPDLRTRMEVGKNEHKRIQANSSTCHKSEITVAGKRIDCVRVEGSTCKIIEIKPDNQAAKDRGNEQLRKYRNAVQDLFNSEGIDGMTGKLSIFKKCVDGGQIRLDTALHVYNFCPSNYKIGEDWEE